MTHSPESQPGNETAAEQRVTRMEARGRPSSTSARRRYTAELALVSAIVLAFAVFVSACGGGDGAGSDGADAPRTMMEDDDAAPNCHPPLPVTLKQVNPDSIAIEPLQMYPWPGDEVKVLVTDNADLCFYVRSDSGAVFESGNPDGPVSVWNVSQGSPLTLVVRTQAEHYPFNYTAAPANDGDCDADYPDRKLMFGTGEGGGKTGP